MSESFVTHVEALKPGTSEAERLTAAATSPASLMAYADEHGLELSPELAEQLVAVSSRQLDDSEIDGVSGGRSIDDYARAARDFMQRRMAEAGLSDFGRDK